LPFSDPTVPIYHAQDYYQGRDRIFYKDWGSGQPIVFPPGWPLSAYDWDAQMLFFLDKGFRVIAHDRRGHDCTSGPEGRPSYRPFHRRRRGRTLPGPAWRKQGCQGCFDQRRAAIMVKTPENPSGLPKEVFDGLMAQLAANRAQFYYELLAGPRYGLNRPGANVSQGRVWNWWRQGMMGGAKAQL
jgi:non-heme chloroperoxidase